MSQNKIEKENSQKPVILSQNQNQSQVEIALSQQTSQSEVSVSGSQISQGQSQDRATTSDSQGSSIASQAQIAPQENVSTQASVSTQDISSRARGRLRSQMSDTCNSLQYILSKLPNRPKYSRIKNIDDLIPEHRYYIPHKIGMKRLLDRLMAKNEQSDSQDGDTLAKTRKLEDDKNSSQPKSQ